MMKQIIPYIYMYTLLLAVLQLPTGCTDEADGLLPPAPADATAHVPFTIRVTDYGYASGMPGTRAEDAGYATRFVKGDTIGLYVMTQKSGTNWRLQRNIAIAFNGTEWIFPASPVVTYEPPTDSIQKYYFAYYPYNRFEGLEYSVNAISSAREFFANGIAKWDPASDQSTPEAYTMSDLMIARGEVTPRTDAEGYTLSFTMEHQMALAVVRVPSTEHIYTAADGIPRKYRQYTGLALDGGAFLPDGPGTARYLMRPGETRTATYYDSAGKKRTFTLETRADDVGKYVSFVVDKANDPATAGTRPLTVGDLYMHDGTILPRELLAGGTGFTPAPGRCIGLVFSTGDPTTTDRLLLRDHPECNRGMAVGLRDASPGIAWSTANEQMNDWTNHPDRGDNRVDISDWGNKTGYSNTCALRLYNEAHPGGKELPVSVIDSCIPAAPPGSSGWYWPGTEMNDLIEVTGLFAPAGGEEIPDNVDYWCSTESDRQSARKVYFLSNGSSAKNSTENKTASLRLRAVLAF